MQPGEPTEELLKSASPSIQYRIRREILKDSPSMGAMKFLQMQIMDDEVVQAIITSQAPDGWIDQRFHGYDSLEAGIRRLCEKGLWAGASVLVRALRSMEKNIDRIIGEMGTVGKVLDEGGFGGTRMIQATILAYAGMEEKRLVQEQIQTALDGFRVLHKVEALDKIAETYRGKTVFKPGTGWPGIYHLRLLAFTHSWRNQSNREIVLEGIKKLVELSPIPYILVRHKSQTIAPAAFAMQEFYPDMRSMDPSQWMMWFHRMELLARLGVVHAISALRSQVRDLQAMLDQEGGWFTKPLRHAWFNKWGAYTGLMLERDWRNARRRVFDLTFRSLLIQHYSLNQEVTF